MTSAVLRRFVSAAPKDSCVERVDLRAVLDACGVQISDCALSKAVRVSFPGSRDVAGDDDGRWWVGLTWTTDGRLALAWERKLIAEGMPAEFETPEVPHSDVPGYAAEARSLDEGREYASLAAEHLRTWSWKSSVERQLWREHAEGRATRAIAEAHGLTYSSVYKVLQRHRRHCGLARENHRRRPLERGDVAAYYRDTEWASVGERRAWHLVAIQRWNVARAADELGLSRSWVKRVVAMHRERMGATQA